MQAIQTPGRPVFWVRGTGLGSDYFGGCDYCGKHMPEAFALMMAFEHAGKRLEPNPVAYGHEACVEGAMRASQTRVAFDYAETNVCAREE
jgi:hypothetical protein